MFTPEQSIQICEAAAATEEIQQASLEVIKSLKENDLKGVEITTLLRALAIIGIACQEIQTNLMDLAEFDAETDTSLLYKAD